MTNENIIIFNTYAECLKRDGKIAGKLSLLPCSKDRIKSAFFSVVEDMINSKEMTKEKLNKIATAYAYLDSFVEDEEADKINAVAESLSGGNDFDEKNIEMAITGIKNIDPSDFTKYTNFVSEKSFNENYVKEIVIFAIKLGFNTES